MVENVRSMCEYVETTAHVQLCYVPLQAVQLLGRSVRQRQYPPHNGWKRSLGSSILPTPDGLIDVGDEYIRTDAVKWMDSPHVADTGVVGGLRFIYPSFCSIASDEPSFDDGTRVYVGSEACRALRDNLMRQEEEAYRTKDTMTTELFVDQCTKGPLVSLPLFRIGFRDIARRVDRRHITQVVCGIRVFLRILYAHEVEACIQTAQAVECTQADQTIKCILLHPNIVLCAVFEGCSFSLPSTIHDVVTAIFGFLPDQSCISKGDPGARPRILLGVSELIAESASRQEKWTLLRVDCVDTDLECNPPMQCGMAPEISCERCVLCAVICESQVCSACSMGISEKNRSENMDPRPICATNGTEIPMDQWDPNNTGSVLTFLLHLEIHMSDFVSNKEFIYQRLVDHITFHAGIVVVTGFENLCSNSVDLHVMLTADGLIGGMDGSDPLLLPIPEYQASLCSSPQLDTVPNHDNIAHSSIDTETTPNWHTDACSPTVSPNATYTIAIMDSDCHREVMDTTVDASHSAQVAIADTEDGSDALRTLSKTLGPVVPSGGENAIHAFTSSCYPAMRTTPCLGELSPSSMGSKMESPVAAPTVETVKLVSVSCSTRVSVPTPEGYPQARDLLITSTVETAEFDAPLQLHLGCAYAKISAYLSGHKQINTPDFAMTIARLTPGALIRSSSTFFRPALADILLRLTATLKSRSAGRAEKLIRLLPTRADVAISLRVADGTPLAFFALKHGKVRETISLVSRISRIAAVVAPNEAPKEQWQGTARSSFDRALPISILEVASLDLPLSQAQTCLIRTLLDANAYPTDRLLWSCCIEKRVVNFRILLAALKEHPSNVAIISEALRLSIQAPTSSLCELCIAALPSADQISPWEPYERTPTMLAFAAGEWDLAMNCLTLGSDARLVDSCGVPVLFYALRCAVPNVPAAREECLEKLIKARADVNSVFQDGRSALQVCCTERLFAWAHTLLNKQADTEKADRKGFRILHYAFCMPEELIIAILDAKTSVNAQNTVGDTPLRLAVQKQSVSACSLLCAYKANPNTPNIAKCTAVDAAQQQVLCATGTAERASQILSILQSHGGWVRVSEHATPRKDHLISSGTPMKEVRAKNHFAVGPIVSARRSRK